MGHADPVLPCALAETIQIAAIPMTAPAHNRPLPDLSTIKAVLFDVDGTLTNSDPLHFKAFQEILVQYNYKVSHLVQAHLEPTPGFWLFSNVTYSHPCLREFWNRLYAGGRTYQLYADWIT
jgi:hypothetical protein